ncbi:MAG: cation transporter [Oscillospiraceae bacterium]|jgi:copper chaperone CopZ|nr:cation transporter [Oscillospiraceae bacterium]
MSDKAVIKVEGMSCKHCAATVTKAAEGVAGVKKAKVDLKAGTATLTYDGADEVVSAVKAAIAEAGYEV